MGRKMEAVEFINPKITVSIPSVFIMFTNVDKKRILIIDPGKKDSVSFVYSDCPNFCPA